MENVSTLWSFYADHLSKQPTYAHAVQMLDFSADSLFLLSPIFHIDIKAFELKGKGFFCWGGGTPLTEKIR